jgi:hypothetical protein
MGEDDNEQATVDTSSQEESSLAVLPAIVNDYISFGIGECAYSVREIKASFGEAAIILFRIPFELHARIVVQWTTPVQVHLRFHSSL